MVTASTMNFAGTIAANFAVTGLLEPHRAARLIAFHARNAANPDFKEVARALTTQTWRQPAAVGAYQAAIARAVQSLVVTRLMELAADSDAAPQVRAVATEELRALSGWLASPASAALDGAHVRATRDDIERFLNRPDATRKQTAPLAVPPGDPIGTRSQK